MDFKEPCSAQRRGSGTESWGLTVTPPQVGPQELQEKPQIWGTVTTLLCCREWTQPAGPDCSGPKMP